MHLIPIFIERVGQSTRERALKAALEPLRFEKAALCGDAGVIGAAALAQKEIMSRPIKK